MNNKLILIFLNIMILTLHKVTSGSPSAYVEKLREGTKFDITDCETACDNKGIWFEIEMKKTQCHNWCDAKQITFIINSRYENHWDDCQTDIEAKSEWWNLSQDFLLDDILLKLNSDRVRHCSTWKLWEEKDFKKQDWDEYFEKWCNTKFKKVNHSMKGLVNYN